MADRVSPLADLAVPGEYGALAARPGVTLSEDMCGSLVQISSWPDTVDASKAGMKKILKTDVADGNSATTGNDYTIMPTGPGRWLVHSDSDDLEPKLRAALKPEVGSVTALTHGRIVVTVAGEKAAWLLATGVALDFHTDSFPVGTVQVSSHHEIGLTIHRCAENQFDLYLFTSFARSFWQWLTRAAAEVGYRVN